jgi:hypothetical protein
MESDMNKFIKFYRTEARFAAPTRNYSFGRKVVGTCVGHIPTVRGEISLEQIEAVMDEMQVPAIEKQSYSCFQDERVHSWLEELVEEKVSLTGAPSELDVSSILESFAIELGEDVVEEIEDDYRIAPDFRSQSLIDSLAGVGIVSAKYTSEPKFSPHNRDFSIMPTLGEFEYEGETIEEFQFPTIGAEKFSRVAYQSVGVASATGVLANGTYSDVIDAARIKLDGYEVVVYSIRTRTKVASFLWGPVEHKKLDEFSYYGQYEQVWDKLYFLSGVNALGAYFHDWEYLSENLIARAHDCEGLIVRMSGKEYRLPWRHSATLYVRDGVARDYGGSIAVQCNAKDGLYDFEYVVKTQTWQLGKERVDKVRPDSAGGINEMLAHASTLGEFIENIPIGRLGGYTPNAVTIVPLSIDRQKKIKQSRDISTVKIRVSGGYKNLDSYRRILMEDRGNMLISTYSVCPSRSNLIVSCGRAVFFKRHQNLVVVRYRGKYYTNVNQISKGSVKIIRLKRFVKGSIVIDGPVFRLYLMDLQSKNLNKMRQFMRDFTRESSSLVDTSE